MAKITLWPDIYKEQGHWLPCVNLAKTLQTAGHTIEFMGILDCEPIVKPYNATIANGLFKPILQSIYPAGHTFENKLEPLDQRWKPHHLLPITRGALDSVFTGAGKPNLLIGGYFTGLESLLIYYKYQVKIAIITTYLRHPQDDPAIHAKAKLLHLPAAVARKLMDSVLPEGDRGMSIDDFIGPLSNAKEMIPCPKEFDFTDPDWVHRAQAKYVEPMIERVSLTASPVGQPENPITIPAGKKVIYATSGSQVQDYEFQARTFFKNLIGMMSTQGMDAYYLVIGAGPKLNAALRREYGVNVPNVTTTLPTNVTIVDWVSQLDMMGEADAVFMHGGLATIKEAIWETVPIIVVPHGKDQMDNALRIKRAGIGLVSEVGDLKPEDLRALLTSVTASTWIQQNLTRMRAIFGAAEAVKESVNVVNGALSA
jgi:UDP:flavonoid glycosyltransferase YjiC (YdhE family)